eukprot:scaffold22931_cov101-Isochrysis_galbana.AAC.2
MPCTASCGNLRAHNEAEIVFSRMWAGQRCRRLGGGGRVRANFSFHPSSGSSPTCIPTKAAIRAAAPAPSSVCASSSFAG